MKLRVFHGGDGDCLLLTTNDDGHRMLVDGGRKGSYEDNTRRPLGSLRGDDKKLDVVCVSHIDNDHISGILRLVEDEVDWRVFDFVKASDPGAKEPKALRPPVVDAIWHNALFELVGDDLAPQVASTLATTAGILLGSEDQELKDLGSSFDNLATGEKAAMELSRRISGEQLGIPLNPPAGGALIKRGASGDSIPLGDVSLFVLGPSDDDIEKLRVEWKAWIAQKDSDIKKLHARMLAEEEMLGALAAETVANPILSASLGEGLSSVTEANLASLMLLAEDAEHTVLLTGDGVSAEVIQGLEHHGKMDAEDRIHVSVLKVQHHGASANVTEDFVKRVTADHYVFCGNGAHHNPEVDVVTKFAEARLHGIGGSGPVRPDRDFKFWFSTKPTTPGLTKARKEYMEGIEALVDGLCAGSGGRMTAEFMENHFLDVLP